MSNANEHVAKTLEHLEKASEAAKPLKDGDLARKIETATEHVRRASDPQKS